MPFSLGLSAGTEIAPSRAVVPGPDRVAEIGRVPARGGLPPGALRRVREYIALHLEENISIEILANIAELSTCHFARAFKQSEGVTPHRYLLQCRVRRVQELLANSKLPLAEIALAVGFADQSHCARRFREMVGTTPRRYRWSTR